MIPASDSSILFLKSLLNADFLGSEGEIEKLFIDID